MSCSSWSVVSEKSCHSWLNLTVWGSRSWSKEVADGQIVIQEYMCCVDTSLFVIINRRKQSSWASKLKKTVQVTPGYQRMLYNNIKRKGYPLSDIKTETTYTKVKSPDKKDATDACGMVLDIAGRWNVFPFTPDNTVRIGDFTVKLIFRLWLCPISISVRNPSMSAFFFPSLSVDMCMFCGETSLKVGFARIHNW